MTTQDFVRGLGSRTPALKTILAESIMTHGELLPHVFMADVARHVVSLVRDGGPSTEREAKQLLDILEMSLTGGDDQVKELVHVSFAENLMGELPDEQVLQLLPPALKSAFRRCLRGAETD